MLRIYVHKNICTKASIHVHLYHCVWWHVYRYPNHANGVRNTKILVLEWCLRFKTPLFNNSLHGKTGYQWRHALIYFQYKNPFETTLNLRPYFVGRMEGLKFQGPLYSIQHVQCTCATYAVKFLKTFLWPIIWLWWYHGYKYSSPSILQPSILRPPLIIRLLWFSPKGQFSVLNDPYFMTTCNIRPHFPGPMGVFKIEGSLYMYRYM